LYDECGAQKDRDRSRSGERKPVENKKVHEEKKSYETERHNKTRSNWSDSSSEDETYSRSRDRKDERYTSYSHESYPAPRTYFREPDNPDFSILTGESVFQNQIPLKLGGSSVEKEEIPNPSSKFSMQLKTPATGGISIKLGATPKPKPAATAASTLVPKSTKVAAIFADDDDEPEEMPAECKMRMKNVGRETPTSAGPNSFGKTKIGFCNVTHITEKKYEKETANKK
jgi:hypothetical protein